MRRTIWRRISTAQCSTTKASSACGITPLIAVRTPIGRRAKKQQIGKTQDWLLDAQEGYEFLQGPLCYAESDDGFTWNKPTLNQFLFKGNRDNNAFELPHTIVSGAAL